MLLAYGSNVAGICQQLYETGCLNRDEETFKEKYSFLMEKNDIRMQYNPLFLVIMIYKLLWK